MERYDLMGTPTASSEEAGVLRIASEVDEKNCGCVDAAITPSNFYKLSNYRIANTAYNIGDTVAVPYHANLFMECIANGTTASTSLDTSNVYDGQQIVDGGVTWEVGVIGAIPGAYIEYTGDTPPAGTVDAGGGAVSRKTYARLFRIFGTKYGAGDGSTTFNLPNMNNGSFAEGSNTAGIAKSAGLPNIAAKPNNNHTCVWIAGDNVSSSGALQLKMVEGLYPHGSSKWEDRYGTFAEIDIDASRCSSVYRNDITTVQPKCVTVKFCIKY